MTRKHWVAWMLILLAIPTLGGCARWHKSEAPATPAQAETAAQPLPFAAAVRNILARDAKEQPPSGAIVVAGSSSIVLWKTMKDDLAPLPVINHGFGGSNTAQQLLWFDELIVPLKPKVIVYYCGDNDLITSTAQPRTPVENFKTFARKAREELPGVRILYVSIKPSPARAEFWPNVRQANRMIRRWCAWQPGIEYVDVASGMLDKQGQARLELFGPDRLHMTAAGYQHWTAKIKPPLTKAWAKANAVAE